MDLVRMAPGPAAAYAFRLGIAASALVGLVAVGVLHWYGPLTQVTAGYVLVVLFPVYLVLVATALSVWLGYDKDKTALRPVYQSRE